MGFFNRHTPPAAKAVSAEVVRASLASVEEELQRIGMDKVIAPTPKALAAAGAFGQPTLSIEQWLVHIFIPRVHEIIAAGGPFPSKSQIADQAFREWRMWGDAPDVDELINRLRAFDALFN